LYGFGKLIENSDILPAHAKNKTMNDSVDNINSQQKDKVEKNKYLYYEEDEDEEE